MGLRKYKRQIAKARMAAAGVGNVNRAMRRKHNMLDIPNWRRALTKEGEKAQLEQARKIKERKMIEKTMKTRKLRRIEKPVVVK